MVLLYFRWLAFALLIMYFLLKFNSILIWYDFFLGFCLFLMLGIHKGVIILCLFDDVVIVMNTGELVQVESLKKYIQVKMREVVGADGDLTDYQFDLYLIET